MVRTKNKVKNIKSLKKVKKILLIKKRVLPLQSRYGNGFLKRSLTILKDKYKQVPKYNKRER